jgi:PAS domain S-box-containing protein
VDPSDQSAPKPFGPDAPLSADGLRAIIASATDAIIVLNGAQRVILFNPAAEQMFRCSAREILGHPIDRFLPEAVRSRHADYIRAFATAGAAPRPMGAERVLSAVRADGEHFPIEAQISRATVGEENLYTVVIRDITERKRAEAEREELLRSERDARTRTERAMQLVERVQTIADAALAGESLDDLLRELLTRTRAVLDTDTAVILLRDGDALRVRAALGIEEDVQRQVRVPIGEGFAGRIAAERRPIVLEQVDYARVVSHYFREKSIHSLAGVPLQVGERVTGVLHVGSVRPRRFSDDEVQILQLAAERIAVAVERAAAHEAERAARAAAEAANRAKDEFLSTISHELRTPLTAMLGWVRVLRHGKLTGDALERALTTIERSGRAQAKLIEDLLDLSRMMNARLRLEMRAIDVRAIVDAAVEALRPMAAERRVTLTLAAGAEPAIVVGDADRLQQVIWNLVHNAVKFTPPAGRVDVAIRRLAAEVQIVIRDTGRGMRADFVPGLFEPFYQADTVRQRHSGGLGLGLSIARQLVQMHRGRLTGESPGEGAGSTFTVVLPLAQTAADASAGDRSAHPDRLDRVRVLVVDDDPNVRDTVQALLEVSGAIVRTAGSVAEAHDVLREWQHDVLVADIRLPDADGYTLLHEIRTRHAAGVPAVAITAYEDEDETRILAAGFHSRLVKPIESDDLIAAIARLAGPAAGGH